MRLSTVTRLLGAVIALTVASAALAMPASAADKPDAPASVPLDRAMTRRLTDLTDQLSDGRSRPRGISGSAVSEEALSDIVDAICPDDGVDVADTALPDNINYKELSSGNGVEALIISADVDVDGDLAYDYVCTFAVFAPSIGNATVQGTYSLTVGSPVDDLQVDTGDATFTDSTDVFYTDLSKYATATLTASGTRSSTALQTVRVNVTVHVTKKQKKAAKKAYTKTVKAVKKLYKKDKKRMSKAKAKRNLKARIAIAKARYKKKITTHKVYQRLAYVTDTQPFALSGSLDDLN